MQQDFGKTRMFYCLSISANHNAQRPFPELLKVGFYCRAFGFSFGKNVSATAKHENCHDVLNQTNVQQYENPLRKMSYIYIL